jgi:aminotransferase
MVTTGASEALSVTFRAMLDPNDEVIVPEPAYVAYEPVVALNSASVAWARTFPANGFRPRVTDLQSVVTSRTKMLLLGYPSNPTGAVLTAQDRADIADFVEANDLYVVADEIYDRLVYDADHASFASLPGMKARTVQIGGFSKAYAMTGWRLGWVAAPADIIEGIMRVHQYVMMSAPTLAQYAGIVAIRECEEDVLTMVAAYDERRRLLTDGLNRIGLTCLEPKGAFYCFPSVAVTGLSDKEFCARLLQEERVAVVPGSAFGTSGAGHVRMCYASSPEAITEALRRMEAFVARQIASAK